MDIDFSANVRIGREESRRMIITTRLTYLHNVRYALSIRFPRLCPRFYRTIVRVIPFNFERIKNTVSFQPQLIVDRRNIFIAIRVSKSSHVLRNDSFDEIRRSLLVRNGNYNFNYDLINCNCYAHVKRSFNRLIPNFYRNSLLSSFYNFHYD